MHFSKYFDSSYGPLQQWSTPGAGADLWLQDYLQLYIIINVINIIIN